MKHSSHLHIGAIVHRPEHGSRYRRIQDGKLATTHQVRYGSRNRQVVHGVLQLLTEGGGTVGLVVGLHRETKSNTHAGCQTYGPRVVFQTQQNGYLQHR